VAKLRVSVCDYADLNVLWDDQNHITNTPHPMRVPCVQMALDAGAAVMVTILGCARLKGSSSLPIHGLWRA
jgi:hypothetical protein